ncbi:MAG TPA: peptidase MA family metallohydrolase [Dehalococcoidia bacterium]|nr:peptidase MA family metallohydrolase [Dehalococcoidia bacterium]
MTVVSDEAVNEFPRGVTFTLAFSASSVPQEVRLFYRLAPDGTGASAVVDCSGTGTLTCSHTLTSGRGIFVIPGAQITYHWEIDAGDGEPFETAEQLYVHEDTRFEFQTLQDGNITLYYHGGTAEVAPAVLAAAAESLAEMSALLQATVDFPVKVFLYETAEQMQPAIASGPTGRGVVILGEVVYSDTAMVSADTSVLDITRHEVAHIVTRAAARGPFDLPGWLVEGIAVHAQRNPLGGHDSALQRAIQTDSVLSPAQINSSSAGGSSSSVGIYYGQSGAMVTYLVETYGAEKFAQLIATFREGSTIDNALETVYGFDQRGLDEEWRRSVGLGPRAQSAATPTPRAEPAADDDRPDAGDGDADEGASSADEDDGGTSAATYVIIGLLAVVLVATAAFAVITVRSRLRT